MNTEIFKEGRTLELLLSIMDVRSFFNWEQEMTKVNQRHVDKIQKTIVVKKYYKYYVWDKDGKDVEYDEDKIPLYEEDPGYKAFWNTYEAEYESNGCYSYGRLDVDALLPDILAAQKKYPNHRLYFITDDESDYHSAYPRLVAIRDETDEEFQKRMKDIEREKEKEKRKKEQGKKDREEKKKEQELAKLKELQAKYGDDKING